MGISFWLWQLLALGLAGFPTCEKPGLPVRSVLKLDIDEPSDLCMAEDESAFFIVSDKGRLYRVSLTGEILQHKRYKGRDLEGLCYRRDTLWGVDETQREVIAFDPHSLKVLAERQYHISGSLNECWESVCPDHTGEGLLLFTEKLPVRVFRFRADWEIELAIKLKFPQEVSGACPWHGAYWVVSDEARTIYRLNPEDFSVQGQWRIPVLNPEGIFITQSGHIWILSDDMHRLYQFDMPQ